MKPITWIVALCGVGLCLAGGASYADTAARLGASFAASHEAFGPIYALHAEYGDFLFEGAVPVVPPGIGVACEEFLLQLANTHLLFVTETASDIGPPPSWIHLRVRADAFCLTHGSTLQSISEGAFLAQSQLQTASESGLFPAIFELREVLEQAFTDTFDGLPEDDSRWRFSVAFSVGALAFRREIQRIDENLAVIFYGGEGRTEPPFEVAEPARQAMERLIALCGRDLEQDEADEAAELARRILDAFVTLPDA